MTSGAQQSEVNIAFKEWAVVCAALATGRQIVVVRKGGIDEGRDGFRVKHDAFWLLPTRFHQQADALNAAAAELLPRVEAMQPPPGKFRVDLFAQVHAVFDLREEAQLERLVDQQILSLETLRQRFFYRQPGLYMLALRVFQTPQPVLIDDSPYIAGCKSWVELPQALPCPAADNAVLDDATFAAKLATLQLALPTK